MEVEEFELALTDLETRLDRLRALYENWFRGYEKSEPSVARKDVERRVYGMRKLLPRNTALRFRYHQLYQRYTTLATYWQRTARQVEEGTYRLQLQRMRRRKDDSLIATKRPEAPEGEEGRLEPKSYELSLDETLNVSQLLDDFELDQVASAIDSPGAYGDANARPSALSVAAPRTQALGKAVGEGSVPQLIEAPAQAEVARAKPSIGVFSKPGNATRDSLPHASMAPPPGGRPSEPTATRPLPNAAPRPNSETVPREAALLASGARAANHNGLLAAGAGAPGASNASSEARPVTAKQPGLPPSIARPSLGSATSTGTVAAPRREPAEPPAGSAGRAAAPRVPPPPPPPSARASVPATQAAKPPVPPPPARPAPGGGGSISDQQIRRIYDEYVAARRKNNEGEVRYETLASSINKMLPDLQKKHQGKRIDFEVILKDGRVGLKPKAT